VILVGLDSAGKSTLLARLLTGQVMDTSPTIGFNVGTVNVDKKTSLTIWDVGGQRSMRRNWRFYLDDCSALVFLVDSSDRERVSEARDVLKNLLKDQRLQGVPLMVLANKKDQPNCMSLREVSQQLQLSRYSELVWEVQACSALNGLGLQQVLTSVCSLIRRS
ncbi:LOW QUALITY PROTEIN: ADP-ribosylation factor-like protein 11, partial [Lampetra planeri]